jgi:hypothetical protein
VVSAAPPRPVGVALVALAVAGVAAGSACKPNLNETVSLVTEPSILAVQIDPPEVNPMAPAGTLTLKALYVGPSGDIPQAPIGWAFCNAREPLAELGPVNNECLEANGPWFAPVGTGVDVTTDAGLPAAACNQFGPDVPTTMAGQTPGRPVDPDSTGGYYQPTRFVAPGENGATIGIAEERIACGLSVGTPDQLGQFGAQYHYNANPTVKSLSIVTGSTVGPALSTHEQGQANPVAAGQHITLEVAWPACPLVDVCGDGICGPDETASGAATMAASIGNTGSSCPAPKVSTCTADCVPINTEGCGGAERFLNLDLASQCLLDARESIDVAWFATGGAFDNDRTGRTDTDTASTSDNGWQAPSQAGTVTLWIVLRDNRGGAGWAEYQLAVQ